MADTDDLSELLRSILQNGLGKDESKASENHEPSDSGEESGGPFSGIDLDMILRLGELFEKMNKPNEDVRLLYALKPHLREDKRAKIDGAVRMLQLISMLPYLRESGILDNF